MNNQFSVADGGRGSGGITGFNPDVAKKNLEDFYEQSQQALSTISSAYHAYFEEMYNLWYSPRAEQFSEKYCRIFEDYYTEICIKFRTMYELYDQAFNHVARAHGSNLSSDLSMRRYFSGLVGKKLLTADSNGNIGLKELQAKNETEKMYKQMKYGVEILKKVPRSIALFDNDNAQQNAYRYSIDQNVRVLDTQIEQFYKNLKEELEAESYTINQSVKQATEKINSSVSVEK